MHAETFTVIHLGDDARSELQTISKMLRDARYLHFCHAQQASSSFRAVSVVRCAVATDYAFGVEDLELMDHVYACILNTSHYDESVIEVR